ncbi:MAG: Ig-like domain-containing protein [Brevinematia bacterium]
MKNFITFLTILLIFSIVLGSCSLFVGIGGEDTTPPTIQIISPKENEIFGSEIVTIKGIAKDNVALSKVMLKVGNKEWLDLGSEENWSYKWDTSSESTGNYTIIAKAIDSVGNESTNSMKVYVDKSLPTVTITSPTNGQYVKGVITLIGSATDDESISNITISTNGGSTFDIVIFTGSQKTVNINYSLNTVFLPEGDNTIFVKATDITGKERTYQLLIKVDNKTPIINITSHSLIGGFLIISEDSILSGYVEDTYPPESVIVIINTNTNSAELTGFSWKKTLSFGLTDPATNSLTLVAVNKVGTTNTTNFTCIVDRSTPMTYITFPSAGIITNGVPITVSGYAIDDTGISRIYLSLENGTNYYQITNTNYNGTNYFWTNINFNQLPEGNITLIAKSYDLVGKSLNSQGVLFTLDKTPPVITIISPTNNTTLSTQFTINASSSDNNNPVAYMVIKIDGTSVKTNSGNSVFYTYSTNTSGEGTRVIEIISVDRAGNPSSQILSVVVNTDPAKVSNVSISSGGSGIYTRGNVTFSGTAYDSSSLSNVGYTIDNITNFVWIITNANTTSSNFSFTIDSTQYSDGLHTIYIRPIDNLGGFVDFSTNIYMDNTKPTVTFVNPSGNYNYYGGLLDVIISAADNIKLSSFYILTNDSIFSNDTTSISGKTSSYISFTWDLTGLTNGITNSIIVGLVDKANNTNYATNYFIVSNDVPQLTVYTPTLGSFVSSNLLITGIASYTNSSTGQYGVRNVQYKIGAGIFQDVQINSFDPSGSTNNFTNNSLMTGYPEGQITLTVRSIASNGSYIDKSIQFYLDYTLPNGNITSLTNNNDYYGTITISGVAYDTNSTSYNSGVKSIKLYIKTNNVSLTGWDGAIIIDNTNASIVSWSTNWDTTSLPVGTNINIIVEISDLAENKRYLTNVINVKPYISSLSTYNSWINGSLTINGYNFGTSSVDIIFNGATVTSASGANNSRTITIPSSARSGYLKVVVNGIESINSNWIDLWTYISLGNGGNTTHPNTKFALGPGDKYFVVQSVNTGGSTKYTTNFLITDASGTQQFIPIYTATSSGGADILRGHALDVRSNTIVVAFTSDKTPGTIVIVLTNNSGTITKVNRSTIDTVVLSSLGTPIMDVHIDHNMRIHVVYSDIANSKIKYAYSSDFGTTWTVEDAATNVGFDTLVYDATPSVYVDIYGNPHIMYYDATTAKLMHIYKSGSAWSSPEIVDSIQLNGQYSDLFIDTNNTIYASYYNGDQGDLMHSYNNGAWNRELVDYSGITGKFTSIDVKGNEKAISYFNETLSSGYLAYYNGTSWKSIQIPTFGVIPTPYGRYGSVKFGLDGNIWVGFISGSVSPYNLWIAKYLK